jgi:His/Glu/Gln/Arg/opine family amino acid ABC transporter permease subunit
MTTLSDPRSSGYAQPQPIVNYDEPPVKPPPLLAVGPIAWIRDNLFSSWLDTLLTLLSISVIVTIISSFLVWSISWANWFAITFNLRQFMLGRFQTSAEWRVQLTLLIVAFIIGFALAAWARVSRSVVIFLVILLALMFVIPPVIAASIPQPPTYFAAGDTDVVSGTSTVTPQPQVAFIGKAGEQVTVGMALELSNSDENLATLHGFGDNASNALLNAAANRLRDQARLAKIEALLAGDLLTANQRAQLEEERAALEIPPPAVETYTLNQNPITLRILRGTTMEVLAEAELTADSAPLSLTLPEDGWYVLDKSEAEGVILLRANGIIPFLERSFIRTSSGAEEEVIPEEGAEGGQAQSGGSAVRGEEFTRMTDYFTTEEPQPRIDDQDVPLAIIIDNQYRGQRSVPDYLRLFFGPFLSLFAPAFLAVGLSGAAGYWAARLADRFMPGVRPRQRSRSIAQWLLAAIPVIAFGLIYGIPGVLPLTDTRRWGGLLLTIMLSGIGIIGAFPLGILLALGRRSDLPALKYVCTIYIEFVRGVPFITVLFFAQLLLPLVNPAFAGGDTNVFRAMVAVILFSAAYLAENVRGGLQSIPPGQEEAAKAVGLAGWQSTLYITLPQALRAVIPALVGQCISLFKDTSLVAIVGLIDLTGIGNAVVAQTEFIGSRREVYMFLAFLYFSFTYTMGYLSRRIEETGSGSARRI